MLSVCLEGIDLDSFGEGFIAGVIASLLLASLVLLIEMWRNHLK